MSVKIKTILERSKIEKKDCVVLFTKTNMQALSIKNVSENLI